MFLRVFGLSSLFTLVAWGTPVFDTIGTNLNLNDDATVAISLNPAGFNFFGTNYTSGTVSANGFVTFGGADGDGCCFGDRAALLSGPARIALAWFDWFPGLGTANNVYLNNLADHTSVTWSNVAYFDAPAILGTLQAQLFANGVINILYVQLFNTGQLPPNGTNDTMLIGISPGGGAADPGESNLFAVPQTTGGTVYQIFNHGDSSTSATPEVYDLSGSFLTFTPHDAGWDVTSGALAAATIPEPASACLLLAGIAGLLIRRRERA